MLISTRYDLKWQLNFAPQYKFDDKGNCINTKTERKIKKTLCGGSIGYCINGKFMSCKSLRSRLVKIKVEYCPF